MKPETRLKRLLEKANKVSDSLNSAEANLSIFINEYTGLDGNVDAIAGDGFCYSITVDPYDEKGEVTDGYLVPVRKIIEFIKDGKKVTPQLLWDNRI